MSSSLATSGTAQC